MNYLTMEQFDQWIAALESGEYPKGTHALKSYNVRENRTTFCCLGVAKEVFNIDTPSEAYLLDGLGTCIFVPDALQTEIAIINDRVRTFEPVIEQLKKWAEEGRIPFGEPINVSNS